MASVYGLAAPVCSRKQKSNVRDTKSQITVPSMHETIFLWLKVLKGFIFLLHIYQLNDFCVASLQQCKRFNCVLYTVY